MPNLRHLRALVGNQHGSALIEFAILGPVVLGMMLAVLQVGVGMQANNALRSVAAETARYASVEYQRDNTPANSAIRTQAITIATGNTYGLDPAALGVVVSNAGTQRVNGAREITVTLTYAVPAILPVFDWTSPTLSHSRPIFVLE